VFYLHVATINVDSPDLTRKFIGTIVEITHNRYNTISRLIAHKRESSNIAVVDSALIILGCLLISCAPESSPQLNSLVDCSFTTALTHCSSLYVFGTADGVI
jgi:hypothetical protein